MDEIEFWTICSANGIILNKRQMDILKRYVKELVYWNSKINLISRKDEENVWERHILHSVSCLKYINVPNKSRCLDVGSGGGLPGIPIAIAAGDIFMTLIDSIAKKIKTTDMLVAHTGMQKLKAVRARAEDLSANNNYRGHFDFVFARAVGDIEKLITWCESLLKRSGKFVLYKGGDLGDELEEVKEKFPRYKIEVRDIKILGSEWINNNEKKIVIAMRP